jgi:hypothetical protein
VVIADCDDDGEDGAGGCMLMMLELMGVENVIVVVSRWYVLHPHTNPHARSRWCRAGTFCTPTQTRMHDRGGGVALVRAHQHGPRPEP